MNKKILKRKAKFIFEPIYRYLRSANHRRTILYSRYYERLKVAENTILYESRDGKSISDSPYAIFKHLAHNERYKNFKHIWSVSNFKDLKIVIKQCKGLKNVYFVKRNSKQYLRYLATCKYLINNSTFQSYFIPKEEQIYINTWHGTPLKRMGFDISGNLSQSQNVVRNFLCANYLISPNEHTTKMFLESYKLQGIYKGEIIQEGYPRIDLTFHSEKEVLFTYLTSIGLAIDTNKQSILYAPTWKGSQVSQAKNDMFQIVADMKYLKKQVGNNYNLFIKVHPFLYEQAKCFAEVKDMLIPDYVDTNELLGLVDILITDYSSIFFDYLVTEKPILFYVWDYDDYFEERGIYFSAEELPGPLLFTIKEVEEAVQNINDVCRRYRTVYEHVKNRFTTHDNGQVTKKIVEYIFLNHNDGLNIYRPSETSKKKLLFYPGGMMNNGITESFINLMDNINFDSYDVSIFMKPPSSKEALNNIARVNKNVRFLFRHGAPVYLINEIYRDKIIYNRGAYSSLLKKLYPEKAYQREYKRYFGHSQFDCCIDFSGYSLFWAKYLLASDAKKKICYMHSDLLLDSERTVNGRKPHRINLRGLFSIYNRFDKLVSVSPSTMEQNKRKLSIYADASKFDYVLNSINHKRILRLRDEAYPENQEEFPLAGPLKYNALFYSRAILSNPREEYVWTRPPGLKGAKRITLANAFIDQDIAVIRAAQIDSLKYYKFTISDRIIGWLNSACFELLSDTILYQNSVDKVAIIKYPSGNDIWSKPFKVEGARKISSSKVYRGMIVEVDFEARTQHGVYNRIKILGEVLGWIHITALMIIKDYDLLRHYRKKLAAPKYKIFNYIKYRKVISNRILEEKNMYDIAVVTNPGNYSVWDKPYPNLGCKEVIPAYEVKNEKVVVTKSCKTKAGLNYFFYYNGRKMGWLNEYAFTIINDPVIISEKEIIRIAKINLPDKDIILNSISGPTGKQIIENVQEYNGRTVLIDREAKTIDETFCHFVLENELDGWLNKRAFEIIETLGMQNGNLFIPYPSEEYFNFIAMGRLSPEKGHDNLINAFSRFHQDFEKAKLYLVGDGPLRKNLEILIKELGLEHSVYLTGQLDNPFTIMKKCDCFVLSSHYEGQPMVLLEAMIHGMKIIATDIVANRTVLENGKYGLLVKDSIEGLEKGLRLLANDRQESALERFKAEEYNKKAMETFYTIID